MSGETKTEAVRRALAERLERQRHPRLRRTIVDGINRIADHCSALPVLDLRGADHRAAPGERIGPTTVP